MKKLLLTIGLFTALTAQAQQLLTPELLWKMGRENGMTVSPDGKKVLYGVTFYDLAANKGNRDLYVATLASNTGSGKIKVSEGKTEKITDTPFGEQNAVWRPDGLKIGFLSAETGSMQLWEMNADGSDRKQITTVEGGISNFAYSPDMKHISFTLDIKMDQTVNELYPDLPKANARISENLMYRHWDGWHDFAYSHPHFMDYTAGAVSGTPTDIMSGEKFDCPNPPNSGGEAIAWSPDGKWLAYSSKKLNGTQFAVSTNTDIYLYELATGKTTNLTEGMMGYDNDPVFSGDGSKLAWTSMEKAGFEADRNRLFIVDLKSKVKTELTTGFDQTVEGTVVWSKTNDKIWFISATKGTQQIYKVEVNSKKIQQVTWGTHNYNSVAEVADGLVGERVSMSAPQEIYKIAPETGMQNPLTLINAELLRSIKTAEVRERTVKTTDGKDMLVWVIYPPDFDSTKTYPTLLYCQGGPQSAVSQAYSFRWNFQLMASNGYIVVAPNRRGLPGFGQAWNDQISGDWGGQAQQDLLSAIDDVCKEKYVDRNRLGSVGASYGGYSVYYLAGNHNKRFKCFIAHCGLFNLESWYGNTEEMFFANHDIGGAYWQNPQPASYAKASPHNYVQNWDTPILVIHGGQDFRVPETEGMQAFQAAQLKGIPSKFLYFPEEGHWILGAQNGVVWHREFYKWLDTYLK
jgi:dipeptidyl aminopeptidase/acylaminoacyl peptidase